MTMNIECTVRFHDVRAPIARAFQAVLLTTEADTAQALVGGFHFKSARSPTQILAAFEAEGFGIAAFEMIEFRPLSC